jgi:hypothetical protein
LANYDRSLNNKSRFSNGDDFDFEVRAIINLIEKQKQGLEMETTDTTDELLKTIPRGSNNRKWMDAYRAIKNRAKAFDSLPEPMSPEQMSYIKGFNAALDMFNGYATGRIK